MLSAQPIPQTEAECRLMRRRIQAIRIKRLGWNDEVFHLVMDFLGYGKSLKGLDASQLTELWYTLANYRRHGKPAEFTYDKQGMYMHYLMIQADWTETMVRHYTTIHFRKTHWNLLSAEERNQLISELKANQKR